MRGGNYWARQAAGPSAIVDWGSEAVLRRRRSPVVLAAGASASDHVARALVESLGDLGVDAIYGATSTDVLSRVGKMTDRGASYALILIGTNDAQAHGRDCVPLASNRETRGTAEQILATVQTAGIEVLLIAPPPASPDQVARHWFLSTLSIGWEHLEGKRSLVRDHDACTFDRANATAHPPMKVC